MRAGHAGYGTESSGSGGRLPVGGDFWSHCADLWADSLASPNGKGGHRGQVRPTKTLGITEEVLASKFCGDSRGRGGGGRSASSHYLSRVKTTRIGAFALG